jgi:uncharacterized DUF497 family protein
MRFLRSSRLCERLAAEPERERICIEQSGQTDAGRYLAIFFIYKGQGRALIISARDADAKELKIYGKQKK